MGDEWSLDLSKVKWTCGPTFSSVHFYTICFEFFVWNFFRFVQCSPQIPVSWETNQLPWGDVTGVLLRFGWIRQFPRNKATATDFVLQIEIASLRKGRSLIHPHGHATQKFPAPAMYSYCALSLWVPMLQRLAVNILFLKIRPTLLLWSVKVWKSTWIELLLLLSPSKNSFVSDFIQSNSSDHGTYCTNYIRAAVCSWVMNVWSSWFFLYTNSIYSSKSIDYAQADPRISRIAQA